MNVEELTTAAEWREAYAVMRELRTHLALEDYLALLEPMRREGYRLLALRDDHGAIVALAGIIILTNFYDGRHVYVYDLVTRSDVRSQGYGATLLRQVEALARRAGCGKVVLSSGVQRVDAHRFYEQRMGYTRASYVFRKTLSEPPTQE
ncbi:GNAT family N-acetyltransferase [Kallotenue papyrolyticum]|uniref:GNAT family N-acetyltransferase n=1 Tax=Kallotenue papyrolyticum TaxID=1325125 RepID=UPI0004927237|nr:GNAT family N-acetyltransferase [Kallotenue papyrolyticum]